MTIETRRRAPAEREQSPVRDVIMDDGMNRHTAVDDAQRARESFQGEALLRTPDAARLLAISERKLWELQNSGQIPVVRIGSRNIRFDPADLRRWIERAKRRRR